MRMSTFEMFFQGGSYRETLFRFDGGLLAPFFDRDTDALHRARYPALNHRPSIFLSMEKRTPWRAVPYLEISYHDDCGAGLHTVRLSP